MKAWAENGQTRIKNGAALCPECHRLLHHEERLKKVEGKKIVSKPVPTISLTELTVTQLKSLAKKHNLAPKTTRTAGDMWGEHKLPPTQRQYLNILSGIVTAKEINDARKSTK